MGRLNDVLTRQQSDMINHLINGENITDIAAHLNVSRQTIYDWMKRETVKAELDRRRRDITRQATAIILSDITKNIRNIQALANDPSDKRTALAANQYLINRVFGNPKESLEIGADTEQDSGLDNESIMAKLSKLKRK